MARRYQSWGGYPRAKQDAIRVHWRHEAPPIDRGGNRPVLPFGNGRSYGDSCLNDGGLLIDARGLDRFIEFDAVGGTLRCEAGVLLSEVLALIVPRGWFLPVTPGTQFVTVGGAIANDVHGKNHHRAGTFGCHVRRFELWRSDGRRLTCSASENADWFSHTIGGLGLTGLIPWAEIALKPISGPWLDVETVPFGGLDEFFALSAESDRAFEYTVAWIDCQASGPSLGRGIFMRANHSTEAPARRRPGRRRTISLPLAPPFSLVNGLTSRAAGAIYYHRHRRGRGASQQHYDRLFYPLDAIGNWNRAYGPRGFLQYQCVVPNPNAAEGILEILGRVSRAGSASFLTVLKAFGEAASPGTLSFPRPGVTLAIDLADRRERTLTLLDGLDGVIAALGGAVYPAKDARMSAASFRRFFPRWQEFRAYVDPRFSSGFWRRVTGDGPCATS